MLCLLDTNVLLRRARPSDPLSPVARRAIEQVVTQGSTLCITAQNVIECWNVFTRPLEKNGFGMSPAQADLQVQQLESFFQLLPETPAVYQHWKRLVVSLNVSGVRVHDARLVAVMQVYGVQHLLTFNSDDFARYSNLVVINPHNV